MVRAFDAHLWEHDLALGRDPFSLLHTKGLEHQQHLLIHTLQ